MRNGHHKAMVDRITSSVTHPTTSPRCWRRPGVYDPSVDGDWLTQTARAAKKNAPCHTTRTTAHRQARLRILRNSHRTNHRTTVKKKLRLHSYRNTVEQAFRKLQIQSPTQYRRLEGSDTSQRPCSLLVHKDTTPHIHIFPFLPNNVLLTDVRTNIRRPAHAEADKPTRSRNKFGTSIANQECAS